MNLSDYSAREDSEVPRASKPQMFHVEHRLYRTVRLHSAPVFHVEQPPSLFSFNILGEKFSTATRF